MVILDTLPEEQALESEPATITTRATKIATTTTTTSTENIPITTDSPSKDTLSQTKAQQTASIPTILTNEAQSNLPPSNSYYRGSESTNTQPQQPFYYPTDAIAKILAERDRQNIQFIPCMCPITMSSMQQLSATISSASTTIADIKHAKVFENTEATTQPIN